MAKVCSKFHSQGAWSGMGENDVQLSCHEVELFITESRNMMISLNLSLEAVT